MSADPPRPPETLAPLLVGKSEALLLLRRHAEQAQETHIQTRVSPSLVIGVLDELDAQRAALATAQADLAEAREGEQEALRARDTARAALARVQALSERDGWQLHPEKLRQALAGRPVLCNKGIPVDIGEYSPCVRPDGHKGACSLTADAAARSGKDSANDGKIGGARQC